MSYDGNGYISKSYTPHFMYYQRFLALSSIVHKHQLEMKHMVRTTDD